MSISFSRRNRGKSMDHSKSFTIDQRKQSLKLAASRTIDTKGPRMLSINPTDFIKGSMLEGMEFD